MIGDSPYQWCADFLFTKRTQTSKWVSNTTGVSIYNKSHSHADRLTIFALTL